MIELSKTSVMNFENAIRGMRNPLSSWEKSDSFYCDTNWLPRCMSDLDCPCKINGDCTLPTGWSELEGYYLYVLGKNDLDLAKRLCKAGSDDRKFLRQILVSVDIKAPMYWWSEYDTYKVATVANSTSKMHKLLSKPFELADFSCEKLEEPKESYSDVDPDISEENEEWRTLSEYDGYRISNRGKIVREKRQVTYPDGSVHNFEEREVAQCVNSSNYKKVVLYCNGEKKNRYVHRLIAEAFIPNPNKYPVVNHIDGNKWNNNVSNLEWCTHQQNDLHAVKLGLKKVSDYNRYRVGKTTRRFSKEEVEEIKEMYLSGKTIQAIANKFGCYSSTISNIVTGKTYKEIELTGIDLFKAIVDTLNELRDNYFATENAEDKKAIWYAILQILPESYNQLRTCTLNYEVLRNIYHARKNHKLDCWKDFCKWIETLPYAKELIIGE